MASSFKILIVDDDPRICRLLARYLIQEGYTVSAAANGKEMRQQLAEIAPDLVLLDLRLPGEDGLTLARQLRAKSDIAIIILTGKSDTIDKIVGLEIGADDYVTKPFDERELLARIRSVLRRFSKSASIGSDDSSEQSVARFRGWALDLDAQELTSPEGEDVRMTNYEFKLLETFVNNPNRVLNRDQIMMDIAGHEWMPLDRSIDVLVRKLRKKLREDTQYPRLIKTVRGTGYKFVASVEFE
jgi:two-component system OmpR family response regulator